MRTAVKVAGACAAGGAVGASIWVIARWVTKQRKRHEIVQTAASYIGTPYKFGGKSYSGIDCAGLVQKAYQAAGIKIEGNADDMGSMGTAVPRDRARAGDVVHIANEPYDHVGIATGDGDVIHCAGGRLGPCLEEPLDLWEKRGGVWATYTVRRLV